MQVTLVQGTPNPIETIARIASICYDSDPKDPMKLVKHLYENGHLSVMEHIYYTFKIEGISRACSHQLVRHRHCSFTQRSQRYCDEDGFGVVIPESIRQSSKGSKEYDYGLDGIDHTYAFLQDLGVPNEDARYILPNACVTELYLSCNLRELIHIANERLCTRAQWEIREVVKQMVALTDPALRFMLVPKCQSGRIICNSLCKGGKK
jgi:thymidylate synthase (FAD)